MVARVDHLHVKSLDSILSVLPHFSLFASPVLSLASPDLRGWGFVRVFPRQPQQWEQGQVYNIGRMATYGCMFPITITHSLVYHARHRLNGFHGGFLPSDQGEVPKPVSPIGVCLIISLTIDGSLQPPGMPGRCTHRFLKTLELQPTLRTFFYIFLLLVHLSPHLYPFLHGVKVARPGFCQPGSASLSIGENWSDLNRSMRPFSLVLDSMYWNFSQVVRSSRAG